MKNTSFFRFLFSFILIALFGCEIEQINPSDLESVNPVTELQVKYPKLKNITHQDIPDIIEEIKGRTLDGEIKQTSGKLSYNNVDIDLDEIMEVVAENNETNFTFALDVKNGPEHHIYNLIVGKDANGNTKEPYVIGYEMKPKDMKAFFKNGLDYSKFKAKYRYYSFESFFTDSKLNRVGTNGDCGDGSIGSTGGDPISQTPPGGTFTHSYQGSTVANVFNTGTPQLPYQYTVTIASSDGTASTATTEAETQVATITSGPQTGTTSTTTSSFPNYSHNTYSTTVYMAPDSGLGSGGGATYKCTITVIILGDIRIEHTVCDDGNAQKRYTGRSGKTDGCPNTEGAIAINTAAKPVRKLFYALDESLSPLEIDYFEKNQEKAKSINSFLIAEGFTQDAKNFAYKAKNAFLLGGEVDFEDKIINNLTGKARCVYNKLENQNLNLFKNTIGQFIDDPEYDLTLLVGNCATSNDACTDANDVNDIKIKIEDLNQSSLKVAALILHEGIHAELHRYVSRFQSGVDPNNRARLLQLYAYYKGWSDKIDNPYYSFTNNAHHVYMVENYINPIASAIRNLDGNRYPLSHYMAYAWDGLEDTGYTSERLTVNENSTNQDLRQVVESSFVESCQ